MRKERIAQENNIYYEHIEAMENGSFMSSISLKVGQKINTGAILFID